MFDLVLLSRYVNHLCISDYQFGFRPKRSTDMCTMILKECMSYYVNNGGQSIVLSLMLLKHSIELNIVNCFVVYMTVVYLQLSSGLC